MERDRSSLHILGRRIDQLFNELSLSKCVLDYCKILFCWAGGALECEEFFRLLHQLTIDNCDVLF